MNLQTEEKKEKMSGYEDWEQRLYDSSFDETLTYLKVRKANEVGFTKEQVRTVLEALYSTSGTQWDRGTIVEIKETAKIAAYEIFLEKWDEY